MDMQRFTYLILTVLIITSFTACNEAENSSVPTETTIAEQLTSTEPDALDLVSPDSDETTASLDYILPNDEAIIEETSEEEISFTVYENTTVTTSDENTTVTTSDENTTVTTSDENTTVEETIIIEYTTGFVGKLIDSQVSGVNYSCDDKVSKTDGQGLFNCQATPVKFSLGNLVLGSIDNMTEDYLIFPQDLLGQHRGAALHPNVTKMSILLQSLDSDANPENGIIITQEIIDLINQELMLTTDIRDISFSELTLLIETIIALDLENNMASRLQLVNTKQAQDHLLINLSNILLSPIQP